MFDLDELIDGPKRLTQLDSGLCVFKTLKKASGSLVGITPPSRINKADFDEKPYLASIYDSYCEGERLTMIEKQALSILLTILEHQKAVFPVTREAVWKAFKLDPNWEDFDLVENHSNYSPLLAALRSLGIYRFTNSGTKKAGIFYVHEDSPFRSYIRVDFKDQLVQVCNVVKPTRELIVDFDLLKKFPEIRFEDPNE